MGWLLGIYIAALFFIFLPFSYFALYHLLKFGYIGDTSRRMVIYYIVISAAIVISTFVMLIFVS